MLQQSALFNKAFSTCKVFSSQSKTLSNISAIDSNDISINTNSQSENVLEVSQRLYSQSLVDKDVIYYQYLIFDSNLESLSEAELNELVSIIVEKLYSLQHISKLSKILVNYLKILFKLVKLCGKTKTYVEANLTGILMSIYEGPCSIDNQHSSESNLSKRSKTSNIN